MQMNANLDLHRCIINHPGTKGMALENTWIEWLRIYLPNRYSVDSAIVVDSSGNCSDQIDVVIYDQWFTPFMFCQNGVNFIPAEGVYAVFEVKPDIKGNVENDSYIEYSSKKIASVRRLHRTSTTIINCGNTFPPRPLTKIIGGILCNDNSYTHNNNNTIISNLRNCTGLHGLDIGCISNYGSFYVDYKGEEDISLKTKDLFQQRYEDYYNKRLFESVKFSQAENSLVTFFLQLTRYLQQAIGTIPAIDLQLYLNSIGEHIDTDI